MSVDEFLVPVRKADIEIGKPLPFAVYDVDRVLLLNRGVVVRSENQLNALTEKGLFRERVHSGSSGPRTEPEETGLAANGEGAARPREEHVDLEALKLMPGDTLQMQPQLQGQAERWTVRVIGQMKGKSLLVTAPTADGKLIFIKDGQTYLVRAFSGLNVCAFKSRVLKSQLQPFPYLHLSWPEEVQAMRIRKTMRAPASIIVAVHASEDGPQIAAGRIIDISVGGAKLTSAMVIGAQDQPVWLSFKVRLGDMEEYVKTPAIIRRCGEEADEQGKTGRVYGVQFGEINQPQRLIIMNLVYQYLLKEPV